MKRFKYSSCNVAFQCVVRIFQEVQFNNFSSSNYKLEFSVFNIKLILFLAQKWCFVLNSSLFFQIFANAIIQNVVSTLRKLVKFEVESNNVVLTLLNVVHLNVAIDNIKSTFFQRCRFQRYHTFSTVV